MSRLLPALCACCALLACTPLPQPDGGTPPTDSGADEDAGVDAGAPAPDAGTPDAGRAPVPAAEWCLAKAQAECERDVRCLRLDPARIAECVGRIVPTCDQAAYTRAVARGSLRYEPDAGAACLDAYGSGSCEATPAACANLFTGTVAPDGGCFLAEECNADGFCDLYDGTCPHHCAAYRQRGETCNGFNLRCRPRDGCELGDAGQSVCSAPKDAGASCVNYDGCGNDQACSSGTCIARNSGPGETCGESNGYPYCKDEYFCRQLQVPQGQTRPPGTCELRAGLGGTCLGYGSCLPSLRCSGLITTGTCVVKGDVGAACSVYGDCKDTLFCDPRTLKCTPLPGDGGDCTSQGSYFECAAGTYCDFSSPSGNYRCQGKQALGQPCTYDSACLSNACEYGQQPDGGFAQRCVPSCSQRADGGP